MEKASEIIGKLKDNVINILRLCTNIDNNFKILLNRINDLEEKIDKLVVTYQQPHSTNNTWLPKPGQKIPSVYAEMTEQHYQQPMVAQPGIEEIFDENGERELTEEVLPKGTRRGGRVETDSGATGQVAVNQIITFTDGRAAFLAQVEIYQKIFNSKGNEAEELVKTVKTNAKGRWIAPLKPGDYIVRITKRINSDSNKQPVDLRYPITIPPSKENLTLPNYTIDV